MIELPESVVLASQITETLRGKRIESVVANQSPHAFAWYSGDPAMYDPKLRGKAISGADIYSGTVRISAGDMSLLIGTPIRYHGEGNALPKRHQLLLKFDDGTSVSCTVQMWGVLFCYKQGDEGTGIPVGHITKPAPSPFEDAFDFPYFESLTTGLDLRALSAKGFLATEQRIQGLGNGVLQDILWTARIHPKRKMASLSDVEFGSMYKAVKSVLSEMAATGGRDTERDLFWQVGGYKTILSKNTLGAPCPACGTIIKKEAYLGGSIYYCEGCQKLE